MATQATSGKVILNFGWEGPSSWRGGWSNGGLDVGVVDLIFEGSKNDISVHIPDGISPATVRKLPFTFRRYHEGECEIAGRKFRPLDKETNPDSLHVTIERIRNLTIKAGIFEESPHRGPQIMDSSGKITSEKRVRRSDRKIKLEVPEDLEIGKTYSLVVTSNNFSLSARFLKEEKANAPVKDEERAGDPAKDEFQSRMRKMGEALIMEGIQNLELTANGGAEVFDSSSTNADIYAHGIEGVIRAGRQMNPEIRVPHTKPSESLSDLNKMTVDDLQARFVETYTKDKKLETKRMRAALAGEVEKMNRIMEKELANSQLLINLGEALERKGFKPEIPQSESFQSAADRSLESHIEALENLKDKCSVQ